MNSIGVEPFFLIELYEQYRCQSKEELFRKEAGTMRQLKSVLNNKIQRRTLKEWKENNADVIKKKSEIYYDEKKQTILRKKKTYYIERKEQKQVLSKAG